MSEERKLFTKEFCKWHVGQYGKQPHAVDDMILFEAFDAGFHAGRWSVQRDQPPGEMVRR